MNKQRRKRCKECNELFTPTYSALQIACSPKCAYAYSKRSKKETKEKNDKELLFLESQQKNRLKLTTLLNSVKIICHEYIRLRDKNKPCISCNIPWHKDFHAGHYFKAELFSSLRFNEFNINGQCVQCNIREEGNLNPYSINLPKVIGQDKFDEIKIIAEQDKKIDFKWDRQELIKLKKYYQKKLKELKYANNTR